MPTRERDREGQQQQRGGKILKFENRKYEEIDFVVPAQDTKGHSERLYFRVQPGHARDLQSILQSKRFPFRTTGDIGRMAINMVIELLTEMEPIPSVTQQNEAIIKIIRDDEFFIEFTNSFELMAKSVNRYVSMGETGQARRLILEIREQIKAMPKGYWRQKYKKELVSKFGHLIGTGQGAGLKEGTEDDEDEE